MLQREALILPLAITVLLADCRPSSSPFTCTAAICCVGIATRAPFKVRGMQAPGRSSRCPPLAQEA